ncbi:MAG: hypothetical protein ACE5WD_14720, partial [Candidatus Aminicenantia bacterium]
MTKIECKVSDLLKVCKYVGLKGEHEGKTTNLIKDLMLTVEKNKLTTMAVDSKAKALFVKLSYKISVAENGLIPIKDIEEFISYLKTFDENDKIKLQYSEETGKISIGRTKPRKKAVLSASSKTTVNSWNDSQMYKDLISKEKGMYKTEKGEFKCQVKLDSSFMTNVLDDASATNQIVFPISVKEGKMIATIGDLETEGIESVIPTEKIKGEVESSYGFGFDAIFNVLNGPVTLHLAQDGPMIVEKNDKECEVMYFIAPK